MNKDPHFAFFPRSTSRGAVLAAAGLLLVSGLAGCQEGDGTPGSSSSASAEAPPSCGPVSDKNDNPKTIYDISFGLSDSADDHSASIDTLLGQNGHDAQQVGWTNIRTQAISIEQESGVPQGGKWVVSAEVAYDGNTVSQKTATLQAQQLGKLASEYLGLPQGGALDPNDAYLAQAGVGTLHVDEFDPSSSSTDDDLCARL